jgi:hypothetical protein
MITNTGTYDITDLQAARFTTAADFGLDTIQAVLADDLQKHNMLVTEMVSDLCEVTTDRQRIYGTSVSGSMVEVDEYGKAPTQKNLVGSAVGFPLRKFQFNLGWTAEWFKRHTPADMAAAVLGAEQAHLMEITRQIKKAAYSNVNYTFPDFLVDNVPLYVKRFVNADSESIPNGPNGEVFDGATHDHYNANAGLTAAALLANVNEVIEHGFGGAVKLAISTTNEAAVRALTGFSAYTDPRLVYRVTDTPAQSLDISRLDNRAIGIFGGAEVWVKSWAIAGYAFAWDAASPQKPFVFRQDMAGGLQGLRIAATLDDYPLYSQFMEAEFGVGVWTRTNGAILDFVNGAYTVPTIT